MTIAKLIGIAFSNLCGYLSTMVKQQKSMRSRHLPLVIGWYEWCALPELNIPAIKAKMDTGARTSSIHAYQIEPFKKNGQLWVRYSLHPVQNNDDVVVPCESMVRDRRDVMSSNGQKEHRYVIDTELAVNLCKWQIELTLSNRDPMRFRLLLGREAMKGRVVIDPTHTATLKKYTKMQQLKLFQCK